MGNDCQRQKCVPQAAPFYADVLEQRLLDPAAASLSSRFSVSAYLRTSRINAAAWSFGSLRPVPSAD